MEGWMLGIAAQFTPALTAYINYNTTFSQRIRRIMRYWGG
jgi:hypothetical protein